MCTETRSESRVRQRDDRYPHELFREAPYNGILVSKAIVDGLGGGTGKYSGAQRNRFMRVGVREYFRLRIRRHWKRWATAALSHTYVKRRPPYTAEEVADFYEECGFDYGLSVDHVILAYRAEYDQKHLEGLDPVPSDWRARQNLTFELAEQFLRYCEAKSYRFTPIGVAQGWSPASYATAVQRLQELGYRYIAFGGFVPLKTRDILACLRGVERRAEAGHPVSSFGDHAMRECPGIWGVRSREL